MGSYFSTESRPDTGFRKEDKSDVLGDEGRKALNACVKVKIYGKPETRRFGGGRAKQLFYGCYWHHMRVGYQESWEAKPFLGMEKTFTVVDVYNAMIKYEDLPYVRIYPEEGSGSEEIRELIGKRRADVERELEEAKANPDGKKMYSWTVAQRRVRDCYAGKFPEDLSYMDPINREHFSIKDIERAVGRFDEKSIKIFKNQTRITDEKILAHRATIQKNYQNALVSPGVFYKCSEEKALESLKKCYSSAFPLTGNDYYDCDTCDEEEFCIFKLYNKVCREDIGLLQPCKYPAEGPGSKELRETIDRNWADIQKECQNSCDHEESRIPDCKYSREEAERRVRNCFAGGMPGDSDVFPRKKDESGMSKIYQTYDIFDIKQSLEYFDAKKFLEKYPEKGHIPDEVKRKIEECRASLERKYKKATTIGEIEHGSGFVIQDHFVLTNKHVVETYLNDKDSCEIRVSNEAIGELSCKVAYYDQCTDLALLYCPDLNLHISEICPLQFSTQPLLPGMQIFSFGYPVSHTGKTALFVTGNVSGTKETYSGPSLTVLNCSLNHGNSGGPVLSWVDGQVRVAGIAIQKHFKQFLKAKEMKAIEDLRESLQTKTISDVRDCDVRALSRHVFYEQIPSTCQVSINLLTLKLYDALETHSQLNLSNALPGDSVVGFIKNSIFAYKGEHKEELAKVIELSQ